MSDFYERQRFDDLIEQLKETEWLAHRIRYSGEKKFDLSLHDYKGVRVWWMAEIDELIIKTRINICWSGKRITVTADYYRGVTSGVAIRGDDVAVVEARLMELL